MLPAEQVSSVEDYAAVVLGSTLYMGHWLEPARELAERNSHGLADKPVWLFSSGPIGDPPRPKEDPVNVAPIMEATGALEHRIFSGKLNKSTLGFGEKAVALAFRAPEGDFRDWNAIEQWAGEIADVLQTEVRR